MAFLDLWECFLRAFSILGYINIPPSRIESVYGGFGGVRMNSSLIPKPVKWLFLIPWKLDYVVKCFFSEVFFGLGIILSAGLS